MARTTLNIDAPLLQELKRLQKEEGHSLGQIVSHLLADALARRRTTRQPPKLRWVARAMRARVDLADKEAVYDVLDRDR